MRAWRYEIYLLVFNLDISLVRYGVEHSKLNLTPMCYSLFSMIVITDMKRLKACKSLAFGS